MTLIIFKDLFIFLYLTNINMMISNTLAHALKAVIYIAVHGSESHKIRMVDLCEAIAIPRAYVAKLLQDLVKHGILRSTKGPHGGFYFTEEDKNTNLMKVVEVIEGREGYTRCMLSLAKCNAQHPCPLHHTVGQLRVSLVNNFQHITIKELVEDVHNGKSFIS